MKKKNKLRLHPALVFLILTLLVMVISCLGKILNLEASYYSVNEVTGDLTSQVVTINNLFNRTGLQYLISNILNNFMRYAKSQIKITLKNNKIILYNDGPNIDKDVLNNIFTPYEKGVRGVFGLGLSIVKKTLGLLNYDINIENVKNGVKFIIS